MLRMAFNVIFKVLLALGAIFGLYALLQYLDDQQPDYIEIYNNDEQDGEYY